MASYGLTTKTYTLVKGASRLNKSTIHEFQSPESGRILFTYLPAGDCPSGPPFGSYVATKGVTPMDLAKKWNDKTAKYKKGTPLAAFIEFQGGKNFDFTFEGPPIEWLLRQAAGATTNHPTCMPSIEAHLPANPVGMESIHNKELEFHKKYVEAWHNSLSKTQNVDGVVTKKHIYHIAETKMQESTYKYSGMSLKDMVQEVINKAYQCGVDISEKANLDPQEYTRIMNDIKERDARIAEEQARLAEEEAEKRRALAKERKMAMNLGR